MGRFQLECVNFELISGKIFTLKKPTCRKTLVKPKPFILLPRIRLEALSGLFRRSRRKPKCDRTATRRHLLPPVATGRLNATRMPLVATSCHWT
jgi:hypothetical protein